MQNKYSRIMIIIRKPSLDFSHDISISVTCFITASVPQREEVCNASFQCCGKDVSVNNFMLYVSDVLYNYDICTIDTKMFFLMSPLQWKKYNMPYKN